MITLLKKIKVELQSHGNGSSCCPHSFPFVTGDTFRAFADVVYDDTHSNFERYVSLGSIFV